MIASCIDEGRLSLLELRKLNLSSLTLFPITQQWPLHQKDANSEPFNFYEDLWIPFLRAIIRNRSRKQRINLVLNLRRIRKEISLQKQNTVRNRHLEITTTTRLTGVPVINVAR